MIEFSGELSEKNKSIQYNLIRKKVLTYGLIAFFLFCIPVTFWVARGMYIYAFGYPVLILELIFVLWITKKSKESYYPVKITIDSNELKSIGKGFNHIRKIGDIKVIEDNGDHYRILFKSGKTSSYFICQKDLITQGSIEEFEEKFSDKIVRKNELKQDSFMDLLMCHDEFTFNFKGKEYEIVYVEEDENGNMLLSLYDNQSGTLLRTFKDSEDFLENAEIDGVKAKDFIRDIIL